MQKKSLVRVLMQIKVLKRLTCMLLQYNRFGLVYDWILSLWFTFEKNTSFLKGQSAQYIGLIMILSSLCVRRF